MFWASSCSLPSDRARSSTLLWVIQQSKNAAFSGKMLERRLDKGFSWVSVLKGFCKGVLCVFPVTLLLVLCFMKYSIASFILVHTGVSGCGECSENSEVQNKTALTIKFSYVSCQR